MTTLVLPAYNEAETIGDVVRRARSYVDRVIVADDGSRDATADISAAAGAEVLRLKKNAGKANALRTGCDRAAELGCDTMVVMDSDGQHRPEDIPRVLEKMSAEHLDMVVGSRMERGSMPITRYLGNRALEFFVKLLFGVKISDIQSGFRAWRTEVYPKLRWGSYNYHADAEMTVRAGVFHLRYGQVPIEIIYRDPKKGMTAWDGLRLLGNILRWRFKLPRSTSDRPFGVATTAQSAPRLDVPDIRESSSGTSHTGSAGTSPR